MTIRSCFSRGIVQLGLNATILAMGTCLIPQASVHSKESPIARRAIDFTEVAKTAIPAVVSINVKTSAKTKPSKQNPWRWNAPDDEAGNDAFGSNDFFRRFFFGTPHGSEQEPAPSEGQASGFIVTADGYILTNCHVVNNATEITVVLNNGSEFVGTIVGQDPNTDIAIVKIDSTDLPFITLGNSDELLVGQWVIAIGNPLGLQATLTVGVVSATGRNDLDLAHIEDFIQTDAAINQGNSGGPLLNLGGEVIGMNTAIFTNMSSGFMGIGFAIPSNLLKHIMDDLIATGRVDRGFLGVVLQPMDSSLAKAFNLDKTEGALVAEVSKDSPADRAGLKAGDIVLKYNKNQVTNIASLRNAIALMKPGTIASLTIMRDGKIIEVPIEIGSFPTEKDQLASKSTKGNKYGFSVQDLTPELAKSLGYSLDKGVVIASIDSGSPAARSGLKKGALIVAINQQKINSTTEFNKLLEATPKGKPLLLLIKQGDAMRFISLQVG